MRTVSYEKKHLQNMKVLLEIKKYDRILKFSRRVRR